MQVKVKAAYIRDVKDSRGKKTVISLYFDDSSQKDLLEAVGNVPVSGGSKMSLHLYPKVSQAGAPYLYGVLYMQGRESAGRKSKQLKFTTSEAKVQKTN